jgi:endonuclease/exonuclease/phosphatase family metal-dependent hydrolase
MKSIFLIILSSLLLFSCGKEISDPSKLTIGTFNIQWLGDGDDDLQPRTDEEYKRIAQVIATVDADILGLQEIENGKALQKVMEFLPDYYFNVNMGSGKQNVAVILKKDVNARVVGEYSPLEVVPGRTRPGLIIQGYKDNFDFYLMVVHFKSTSRYDSTDELRKESFRIRREQARVVSNWADSLIQNNIDQDVFIVGDFNDSPLRPKNQTLKIIDEDPNLLFENADMKSCINPSWYVIDHVIASQSASRRRIENSTRLFNFYSSLPDSQAKKISDHCPVTVTYDVTAEDND